MPESLKETLHDSSETEMLFIDRTSTHVDVQDMQDKSGYANIKDIPRFTEDDCELETVFQHSTIIA